MLNDTTAVDSQTLSPFLSPHLNVAIKGIHNAGFLRGMKRVDVGVAPTPYIQCRCNAPGSRSGLEVAEEKNTSCNSEHSKASKTGETDKASDGASNDGGCLAIAITATNSCEAASCSTVLVAVADGVIALASRTAVGVLFAAVSHGRANSMGAGLAGAAVRVGLAAGGAFDCARACGYAYTLNAGLAGGTIVVGLAAGGTFGSAGTRA